MGVAGTMAARGPAGSTPTSPGSTSTCSGSTSTTSTAPSTRRRSASRARRPARPRGRPRHRGGARARGAGADRGHRGAGRLDAPGLGRRRPRDRPGRAASRPPRPTSLSEPTYVEHGVVHYCVTNVPGQFPRTASAALSAAVAPRLLRAGRRRRATGAPGPTRSPRLAGALNVDGGRSCTRRSPTRSPTTRRGRRADDPRGVTTWLDGGDARRGPPLAGDVRADVVVIGAASPACGPRSR
jgi:hypothetical protein